MAPTTASVRFVYSGCADVAAMRRFYSELLGLNEIWWAEGDSVAYDCDGLQFTFVQVPGAVAHRGWARQPGWEGGAGAHASWSIVVAAEAWEGTVARVRAAGVPHREPAPEERGYLGWTLRDPMGNTVEVVRAPEG